MHDGCSAKFEDGIEVLNKVRMVGFSNGFLPIPFRIKCECGNSFDMKTFESFCDKCNTIYAVTPCNSFSIENISKISL